MVKTDEIRGLMAKNRITQEELAKACGISSRTFQTRMKRGIFGSNEMQKMIEVLHIENPVDVFFARE